RVRGRYLQTVDPDTGNVKTKQRPKSEWKVRRSPELQIVPWSLWKKAQQRKQECKRAYSSEDQECQRTDAYPTTLVRPICGVCNKPLWLGRSGKYASFCCINGRDVKNGCTFRGYKSVCIVENAVLSHVKAELLSGKHVESLTLRTNEFLKQEAAKPKQDVTPITRELRQLRTKIERITDAIEEGEGDVTSLMRRQKSHGKRIEELNAQLRDANIRNEVPQPLDADVVRDYINQLRELLQKDVAQAAPIIRQLTGPVVVHQVKQKGKKKAAWIAKFRSNLIPVVMELARSQNCPTKSTLAYLCTRTWTMELPCEIRCESIRAYERIAPRVVELIEQGASIETIARVTETSWTTVQEALDFAKTGNRPKSKPTGKKDNKRNGPPRHQVIADEVARRREAGESFAKISKDLSVSASTATRAFDFANREQLEAAAEEGETPRRGHWRRIPAEKINEVRRLLHASKLKPPEIARRVGVSPQTVRRERDAIRDEE
ncbi:MAG TPA: hypothetical protein P5307_12825, partial [Pirellulaceae bacterium]|nr:hypothetical protein [Pirellulaceae bacterium]